MVLTPSPSWYQGRGKERKHFERGELFLELNEIVILHFYSTQKRLLFSFSAVHHEANPRQVRLQPVLRPQLRQEGVDRLRGPLQVGPSHRSLRPGHQNCFAQESKTGRG